MAFTEALKFYFVDEKSSSPLFFFLIFKLLNLILNYIRSLLIIYLNRLEPAEFKTIK